MVGDEADIITAKNHGVKVMGLVWDPIKLNSNSTSRTIVGL